MMGGREGERDEKRNGGRQRGGRSSQQSLLALDGLELLALVV